MTAAKQRVRSERRQILDRLAAGPATFDELHEMLGCSKAHARGVLVYLVEHGHVVNRQGDDGRVYELWANVVAPIRARHAAAPRHAVISHRRDSHQGVRVG